VLRSRQDDVVGPSDGLKGLCFAPFMLGVRRTAHTYEMVTVSDGQSRAIDTQLSSFYSQNRSGPLGEEDLQSPRQGLKHAEKLSHNDCASPLFRTGKGGVILGVRLSSERA